MDKQYSEEYINDFVWFLKQGGEALVKKVLDLSTKVPLKDLFHENEIKLASSNQDANQDSLFTTTSMDQPITFYQSTPLETGIKEKEGEAQKTSKESPSSNKDVIGKKIFKKKKLNK